MKIIKKHKKLLAIVLVVGVIAGFVYLNSQKGPAGPKTDFEPLPNTGLSPEDLNKPTGEKIVIDDVTLKNIYDNSEKVNSYGDAVFAESDLYRITYILQGKYFLISILSPDFDNARVSAETEFLRALGITKPEACKLEVRISTPAYINPERAGEILKPTFCE